MALALLPIVARGAAQLGLGAAASAAIDAGINKGIPYAMHKAREATSKFKVTHGLSNAIGKAEKAYDSKTGKVIRNVASTAGSLVAFGASGKLLRGASKGAGAVGRGLRGAKNQLVGAFKGKKGNFLSKGARKFQQAKTNLSEKTAQVGKAASKGWNKFTTKVGEKFGRKPALPTLRPQKVQSYTDALEQEIKAGSRGPPLRPRPNPRDAIDKEIIDSYYSSRPSRFRL